MTSNIWFGQFNTVGGAVREEGPYIGIFEGGANEPDSVGVYILVEPCGSASDDLCASTITAIARGFDEPGRALTASLLRSLNAGHTFARRWHPGDSDPEFGIGVTIVATRRREAYLAQAGPALACVRTGGVTRLIEPMGDAASHPLGRRTRIAPSFSRLQLHPGDSLLLTFSSATRVVDPRRLTAIAAQGPEHALPDLYLRSRGIPDFAALYLAVTGEATSAGPRPAVDTAAPADAGAGRPQASALGTQPSMARAGTLAVEDDESMGDGRRNGHHGSLANTVPALTGSRTPLGRMDSRSLPVTRRQMAIGGLVAALVLALLLVLPNIARQGKHEKFNQLVRGADQAISAAEREPDAARRRVLLARAQSAVDEARSLRDVRGELSGLEERLSSQLAAIDGVRELPDLIQVVDLTAPGLAAPAAGQLALGELIYLLDASAGKVIALPRAGDPKPLTVFEEGRPAGPNRTGKARHITWWAAEGNRAGLLLVLDDQRRLYSVDVRGDIRPLALGDTSEWKTDTGMAVGTSHLYVLDAGANQVWRYALNAGGFPGAPEPLLTARASLKDVSGISIAAGGPIIATTDGRLLRVADGLAQPMQPVAMDRPLLAPAPPQLNSGDGLLYVADRGNQRVVLLGSDATFRGQLVHHRLAGLQSIALDEAAGVLYAIAGQSLVRATIPK
jgi:hypothetical protein